MTPSKTARLTLRLTPHQKELIARAAAISGVTLTEFVTGVAAISGVTLTEFVTGVVAARAHRVLDGETKHLDAEQGKRDAESLLNLGEPNPALRDLLARPHLQDAATLPAKLTLHQAAQVLNASAAHVKCLLEQGRIAHHGEGARLRIDRDSLLAYKARDDQERQAALDELTREAQEQGHGY